MILKLLLLFGIYPIAKIVKDWLTRISPKYIQRLNFYSQFINKGDLCFDIGANLGNRTEVFFNLGARVVAVEPQDVCMRQLKRRYQRNSKIILLQKAVGEKEGKGKLMLNNAHPLSSMSEKWVNNARISKRWWACKWDKTVIVKITTLDKLVEKYGKPVFCKIDVEGFELQVLRGLSQPIGTISFEFTPELINSIIYCIKHLVKIGYGEFNYSVEESMRWGLSSWITSGEIRRILTSLSYKNICGDVYARPIEKCITDKS